MANYVDKSCIKIGSSSIARNWLFAPATYLVDSFTPFVEEIYLPVVATEPGSIKFTFYANGVANPPVKKYFSKIKSLYYQKDKLLTQQHDNVYLDLRAYSPGNLSHSIMIHLPLALTARAYLLSIKEQAPTLIFPTNLPAYVHKLFVEIGFELLITDQKVVGKLCEYEVSSVVSIRSILPDIIKDLLLGSDFSKELLRRSEALPKKVFISRKDTRRLTNEAEVEEVLKQHGYQKIYMEDYDILDQVAMVSLADNIVAIHGAALGPLVFRSLFDIKPLKFVEIFTPAHMANVYRVLTYQLGGEWIGVRGKLWPKLVEQAYECESSIVRQYSLLDFEVCLLSLEKALNNFESPSVG